MPKEDTAPSSQPPRENNSANQKSSSNAQQSNSKPPSQRPAGIVFVLLIIIIIVATQFYLQNGKPLFPLPAVPSTSSSSQPNSVNQAAPIAEPAFILLGEYDDELYTYNRGVTKVYAYNFKNKKEREVCKLMDLDTFRWHKDGKLLAVSRRYNTQGSIYLLDLKQKKAPLEPILITNRETVPYFPRNLSVESTLPLAWTSSGEKFAFVARDIQDSSQSLFIYNLPNKQLIYTPARNLKRIADLVWGNGDEELFFTAINDDRENRYRVNKSGGDFGTWDAQP